ncbi:HIRAN domain-containing protein [Metasolibacillus meyeri]|uniref:HIRAN domain-containing protein n=1 Tax=Metasolibacillus meyeri TaxID=1071052 RepID=UPI000D31146D|nr:HIRAN domain-containing protein [Metasolibacillus meyeri]
MLKILKSLFSSDKKPSQNYREHIDNEHFRQYTVSIAGITFQNSDESSRTQIASRCRYGQELILTREPENPHDSNAVKIMTLNNQQLGYLDRKEAKDMQATLKGTSKMFGHAEVFFVEFGTFENDEKKPMPYCTVAIRKHYKSQS